MRLEAKNVGYKYGKNNPWLFRHLNLQLAQGRTIGLLGPSGTGKSTLARILAGYLPPLEGEITLEGKLHPRKGYNPVQLVFQHPELAVNPRWRMRQVLHESGQDDEAVLEALGIHHEWLERWPTELSGGELQRICVARALVPATRFLIADEMTTMLDAITQAQIWQFVLAYAKRHQLGILVISHDRLLLERICDQLVTLDELHL